MNWKIGVSAVIIAGILLISGILVYYYYIDENPAGPVCGDGYCDPDYETYENCPGDCSPPPNHCGNGICEPGLGETYETCPGDCEENLCGNGIIDPGENCQNCPDDCGVCQPDVSKGLGFRRPLVPVSEGDTFWITVYLDPASGQTIGTFILDISYDDSILEYKQHTPSGDWSDWWYAGDQTSGKLTDVQSFDVDGQSSKANLFQIQFKAINTGTATLTFDSVEITNDLAESISVTSTDNTIDIK